MFHSLPTRWLAIFPAMAAVVALAQPAAAPSIAPAPAPAPAPVPAPASADATERSPPVPTYKSAFEGYRPFADEKPIPWREANETVYRRGGWQAYAKEAAGTGSTEDAPPKGAAAAPPVHSGHTMPMPEMKEKP